MEAAEIQLTRSHFFALLGHQDSADGSHRCKVLWDDQLSIGKFQHIQKGPSHPNIRCHPSLEGNGLYKIFPLTDIALEISCQRIAEASNDVVIGCGDLLKMDHIRLGKDTASPRNSRGVCRFQSKLPKLFNRQAESAGLLIQKGSCAGSAESIHREVTDLEVALLFLNKDQFGIFSSDIDDRPDLWIKILNSLCLGDDLIDEIPTQDF